MTHSKDYYEILGIDPEASQEEIKKAYWEVAKRLYPDRLGARSESALRWAEERLKKVNEAYKVLGNPQDRQQYDIKWRQRGAKPKPVVNPDHIYFKDAEPGEIKVASFIVKNVGVLTKEFSLVTPILG